MSDERIITEQNTKLTDIVMDMKVSIINPVPVCSTETGKFLGTAVLEFVNGGVQARFFLDAHTPEAFDLAQEPDRCRFGLVGALVGGELRRSTVWLSSK
jgi:hypothetical protein